MGFKNKSQHKCKSNKSTNKMQQFYKFITWRFVSRNMFSRPSSGAYNRINSLWFLPLSVVVATLLFVVSRLTTLLLTRSKVKPKAVNEVVSSWWWAWKHVERHKTSSNKLVKLLHLAG